MDDRVIRDVSLSIYRNRAFERSKSARKWRIHHVFIYFPQTCTRAYKSISIMTKLLKNQKRKQFKQ